MIRNRLFGWSHYVALLTISTADDRRFYVIEASENSWGARELERQMAALVYERVALSRDKEEIRQLFQKGLVIEKPGDALKNPFVLEFLDMEAKCAYSEHALETAIIDRFEHFFYWNWARGFFLRRARNGSLSTMITSMLSC